MIRFKNGGYDVRKNVLYWNGNSLSLDDCLDIQHFIKNTYGIDIDTTSLAINHKGNVMPYTDILNGFANDHWGSNSFKENQALHLKDSKTKHDVLKSYLSDRSDNIGKKLRMSNGGEMSLAQWKALHNTSECITGKTIIINETQAQRLISESHGVSNDYLGDLVDFITEKLYNSTQGQFSYQEIKHCFDSFPENLKKYFRNSKLIINPMISNTSNGRCEYNPRKKLITVSLRYQDKHNMKTTLYHELTHMIDYAVNKSSKGDKQTKIFTKYNNKFINNKSQYREFNQIIYGFTTLEMRGRLAAFKIKLYDWLMEQSRKEYTSYNNDFLNAIRNGYKSLFQYFKKEIPYTEAYRYCLGYYEDKYESLIKQTNYGNFGYRGIIELYNNLRKAIDLQDMKTYNERDVDKDEFEFVKAKVVNYFDNLIQNYKKQIYKVAMDVWYEYIDYLKGRYGDTTNFRKFMQR